jgi:hypothetical protein
LVVGFHIDWLLFISLPEVFCLEIILSNKRTVKIPHIIEKVKLVHKRVSRSLILYVTPFERQLCFSLSAHQPSLWLLFYNIDFDRLNQTEKENATRYLGVSSLFGNNFLFVAFYHIDAIYDLVLGIVRKGALARSDVVLVLEVLMIADALDAFALNLLIFLCFFKSD